MGSTMPQGSLQPTLQANMQPGMQPGMQSGMQSNPQTVSQPVSLQSAMQPNPQACYQPGLQSNMQTEPHPRKPWYAKWWVWLLAALGFVFVIIVASVALWFSTHARMPEVVGLSPEQASQQIQASSENWNIEIRNTYGSLYDNKYESLDFVVIETDPEAGTVLDKLNGEVTITLIVDLSQETLAEVRETAIQNEIQDSLENGFASEDYYDGGSFIVFKAVDSDPSISIHTTSQEFAEQNKSLYQSLAEITRANVIATAFTADGFLYAVSFTPYSKTTEEEASLAAEQLGRLLSEADEFAEKHRKDIADIYVATNEGWGLGQWPGSEWSYDGETLTFFAYSPFVDTRFGDGEGNELTAKGTLEAKKGYELQAKTFAQIFQCDVVINFYDDGATEPFFSTSSEKLPWL